MIKFTLCLALAYLAQELMERINPREQYFGTVVVGIVEGEGVKVVSEGKPRLRPWRPRGGYLISLDDSTEEKR